MSRTSSSDDPLIDAVLAASIPQSARLLVAVSGGPDSVALLDGLRRAVTSDQRAWTLRVGHVNHGLRGEESDADEAFVRALGERWGLAVDVQKVNTQEFAASRKLSLETAARELRYQSLQHMLARWPGDLIVTAHTQDDQVETLLLRLLRGTGILGLSGMRSRRDNLVRPFLTVSRETIVRTLQNRGLGYRLDSSNLDTRHARNRIRRDVIPSLELLQPRVRETVARTAALLGTDADFILAEAQRAASHILLAREPDEARISAGGIMSLQPALQVHVLRLLLEDVAGSNQGIEERHVRLLAERITTRQPGTLASLPHDVVADLTPASLAIRRASGRPPANVSLPLAGSLDIPGTVQLPDGELHAVVLRVTDRDELHRRLVVCGPDHALCDADRLSSGLLIRPRQPGDRIVPLGMTGSRKVQDVLVDARVPRVMRDTIPLVANDRHIVWIPGILLDNRVSVSDTTRHVVHLVYRRRPRR